MSAPTSAFGSTPCSHTGRRIARPTRAAVRPDWVRATVATSRPKVLGKPCVTNLRSAAEACVVHGDNDACCTDSCVQVPTRGAVGPRRRRYRRSRRSPPLEVAAFPHCRRFGTERDEEARSPGHRGGTGNRLDKPRWRRPDPPRDTHNARRDGEHASDAKCNRANEMDQRGNAIGRAARAVAATLPEPSHRPPEACHHPPIHEADSLSRHPERRPGERPLNSEGKGITTVRHKRPEGLLRDLAKERLTRWRGGQDPLHSPLTRWRALGLGGCCA